MEHVGTHCILELHECSQDLLDDPQFVASALAKATRLGLSTLLKQVTHHFHPHGVTVLGLLAESHISIHTWPEHRYAAADVFTCGEEAKPQRACQYLIEAFGAVRHHMVVIGRGGTKPTVSAGCGNFSATTPDGKSALPESAEVILCLDPNLVATSG